MQGHLRGLMVNSVGHTKSKLQCSSTTVIASILAGHSSEWIYKFNMLIPSLKYNNNKFLAGNVPPNLHFYSTWCVDLCSLPYWCSAHGTHNKDQSIQYAKNSNQCNFNYKNQIRVCGPYVTSLFLVRHSQVYFKWYIATLVVNNGQNTKEICVTMRLANYVLKNRPHYNFSSEHDQEGLCDHLKGKKICTLTSFQFGSHQLLFWNLNC